MEKNRENRNPGSCNVELVAVSISFFDLLTYTTPTMEASRAAPVEKIASQWNPPHLYAAASATYLTLLSIPLLAFPRVLLLLSTPRGAAGQAQSAQAADGGAAAGQGVSALGPELTPIERFASYAWGSAMLALSALALVQTGAIPLTSAPLADPASSGARSPYRFPTILILTIYFTVLAVLGWNSAGTADSAVEANSPSELGIGVFGKLIALPHAALAFAGFGVLMFGSDVTRNQKKSGDAGAKDKASSSFPFKSECPVQSANRKGALCSRLQLSLSPPHRPIRRKRKEQVMHAGRVGSCRCGGPQLNASRELSRGPPGASLCRPRVRSSEMS